MTFEVGRWDLLKATLGTLDFFGSVQGDIRDLGLSIERAGVYR
jgi:hypothetical protein